MSISPDGEETRQIEVGALEILRSQGNPFESLASPHRAAEDFAQLHCDELHAEERRQLLAAIDSYRLSEYSEAGQLKPARAVTVLGDRGAGKTHLLQTLIDRADRKAQLVVRPSTLAAGQGFEEYLLAQLRIALGEKDEFHQDPPLELIARRITRRLLLQALQQLSPVEQLFSLRPDAAKSSVLCWSGAERVTKRWGNLLAALAAPASTDALRAVLLDGGLAPDRALALVEAHLRRRETSTSLVPIVRRSLYAAMARRVLLEDPEVLPTYLREGYLPQLQGDDTRADLVRSLLHVLIEACAICRMPVVVAFDNFEQLFSPFHAFDGDLARQFFQQVAQAIDATRGVLFLLFFEQGLYDAQAAPLLVEGFVQARINQTIPALPGFPAAVRLTPPSAEQLVHLVHTRVQRMLADYPNASQLRKSFPFADKFAAQQVGSGVVLRNVLMYLRDAYDTIVYGRRDPVPGLSSTTGPVPPEATSSVDTARRPTSDVAATSWPLLLDTAWTRAREAARKSASETTLQELHECLGGFLQAADKGALAGWTITRVVATDSVGDNPAYGIVTRIDCQRADGAVGDGPKELKVGVGFLLGLRRGTLVDLRSKFDYFRKYGRGARLIVLWPRDADGDLIEAMSEGTRKVWDENRHHHRKTQLRRVTEQDLRALLTLRHLPRLIEKTMDQPPPAEVYADFLREKLRNVLPLLVPPSANVSE